MLELPAGMERQPSDPAAADAGQCSTAAAAGGAVTTVWL